MKIGIIGLGFVGLSLALVLASKGNTVLGIDSDGKKIGKLKNGIVPFYEPKMEKILEKSLVKSLTVSSDISIAVKNCKFIFITVGTPISKDGFIDLTNISLVSNEIGKILKNTTNRPLIVIKSTVVPGTTLKIKSILQKSSRKKCGIEFGLLTNPEFLREGNAIDDTLNPHLIVIGGEKQNEISKLKNFYKSLHKSKIPFVTTNFQTAELIKYANNSFLATKISFINQIANICQSIPGTNVDDIAKAIGYDPRIGTQFLSAGPGFGGSCLPKDLQTLIAFSTKLGQEPKILKGVQKTNSEQVINLTQMIRKLKRIKRKKITILGLAFKENSDDIRESVSIKLIKKLLKYNYKITVHDPKAISNVKELFNDKINYSLSITDALKDSECVVIMTSCYEYKHLKKYDFNVMKNKIIIDTRRIIDGRKMNIEYHALGLGNKKIPLSRSN